MEKPRTPPPSNVRSSYQPRDSRSGGQNEVIPNDSIRSGVPLVVSLLRKLPPSIVKSVLRRQWDCLQYQNSDSFFEELVAKVAYMAKAQAQAQMEDDE